MLAFILECCCASPTKIKSLRVEEFVFFDTCFDIVAVELRVDLFKSPILNVGRLLSAFDSSILEVFDPGKRLLELGFLGEDALADQLLNSLPLCHEAEAGEHQEVEVGRLEVVGDVEVEARVTLFFVVCACVNLDRILVQLRFHIGFILGLLHCLCILHGWCESELGVEHHCHLNVKLARYVPQIELTQVRVVEDRAVRLRVWCQQLHFGAIHLGAQGLLPPFLKQKRHDD